MAANSRDKGADRQGISPAQVTEPSWLPMRGDILALDILPGLGEHFAGHEFLPSA
jgi:hypothetical protein